jgi:hypothetical protein
MITPLPEKLPGEWSADSFGGKVNEILNYLKEREKVEEKPRRLSADDVKVVSKDFGHIWTNYEVIIKMDSEEEAIAFRERLLEMGRE